MPKKSRTGLEPSFNSNMSIAEDNRRNQEIAVENAINPEVYRKRSSNTVYSSNSEEDHEEAHVDEILHQFGNEVQKSISSKRRRVQQFTKQCNASRERLDAALATQRNGRSLLHDEFKKQIGTVLGQWQCDIDRIKENEDKLNTLWNHQMKLVSQTRTAQGERFKAMKLLHEQYCKSVNDLEDTHEEQHFSFAREANKELKTLQKKFLTETKIQEVANIRKSLQSLIH